MIIGNNLFPIYCLLNMVYLNRPYHWWLFTAFNLAKILFIIAETSKPSKYIETESKNYWYSANNENCHLNTVITTESMCQFVAAELEIIYIKVVRSALLAQNDRPAGCYSISSRGYFNSITDAPSTTPQGDSRGICTTGIILHHIFS